MPIFDFICENCNYQVEQLVNFNYPKKSKCPKCHTNSFIRLIGIPSFRFIGEGFYENDKKINDAIKENNKMNQERKKRAKEDKDF